MPTSGTLGFAPTLVDIFEEAFERATGDELRHGYQVRSMRRSLNLLLLDWQNQGFNLWQLADTATFVLPGVRTVPLATDCVDTIEVLVGLPTEQTTLATTIDNAVTAVVLASALSITVPSTLYIGEEAVTVTVASGVNLTVTRSASPTAHTAGEAVYIPIAADAEHTIERRSVPDYAAIPNKSTSGRPSTMLVRREAAPVTLTVWPVPDRVYAISYWYLRRAEDAGTGGNDPDVPIRFIPALIAGLAFYIGQKTPSALANLPTLEMNYMNTLKYAQSEDREKATLRMVPYVGRIGR